MSVKFTVDVTGMDAVKEALARACSRAENIVAQQVMKDTAPFVPKLTGSLIQRTRVVGDSVVYPGPYARYLYFGKVMVNRETLKGPRHFIDKYGNEQIKFPKGSKLIPTDRNLRFNKSTNKQAQSHWFEASKAQNLDKWLKKAQEEVKNDL